MAADAFGNYLHLFANKSIIRDLRGGLSGAASHEFRGPSLLCGETNAPAAGHLYAQHDQTTAHAHTHSKT